LIQKWYADILELLKGMVDLSMFLEWHFLLMSLSTILLFTWFIIPYFYLAEIMVRNGYSEQEASTLLSVIGFANFSGMVSSLLTHDSSSEVAFWAMTPSSFVGGHREWSVLLTFSPESNIGSFSGRVGSLNAPLPPVTITRYADLGHLGTVLQTRRSRFRFPMRSLGFSTAQSV
jgi:hypothetical protein